MNKKIFFFMMLFLLCRAGLIIAQTDSIVKVNLVKYQQIRNNKESYETTKVDLTGETSVNTHSTAYYDGNDLKFIEVIYLVETGHRQIEYYFDKGNLFFALERNQPPDKIMVIGKNGKVNSADNEVPTENRYYFYEDKLIRWYDNDRKGVDIKKAVNQVIGGELITIAYKMKEKLKK